MQRIGRSARFGRGGRGGAAAALLLLLSGAASGLVAQGVTSAAVQGRITSEARGTVENAIVALTNTSTGNRQQTTTNSAGRFFFENVPPGGPYTIDVRAIGFQAASKTGVMLVLGQRYVQDFTLAAQVVTLEELTVIAVTNPLINSARTGAGQIVTDTLIQRYPLLGRNFTDLLRTSPQVLSGSGIAGQNSRYNTILIDGGVNNDLFGLASGGTPGGTAGAKPMSVEALQEFQILSAPFDIRQGSFSGGLVNAITKQGTNALHGSLFTYFQRPELVGKDTARLRVGNFDIKQYGGTLGGPIIRDKLHFFVSADIQTSTTPFFGPEATEPTTGISVATAERAANIIRTKYGFDPGGVAPPQNLNRPDKNIFAKLNYQLGSTSQLELSYNYVNASQDVFNRNTRNNQDRDGWQLNNSGHKVANHTNTVRGKFVSLIGKSNLEVLLGYQRIRDAREIPNQVPLIMVEGDLPNNYLAAGGERFSHGNELDQDVFEITGNWTFNVLRNHQITVGTHNEFFKFRNLFANNRFGTWTFGDVDSLDNEQVRRFQVQLESRPGGFTARFSVRQLGFYLQDAWRPTERLTITGGLRYDVPIFGSKPFSNPDTAVVGLGVDTGIFPSGNGLFSPRISFNYDAFGQGNTVFRGGLGVFSGRPPYVWMSNAYTNTGSEQLELTCSGAAAVPAFTVDINNIPQACANNTGVNQALPLVNYFDRDFEFQQSLRLALGVDHRLPWGVVGTFDFLRTWNKNHMYQVDDNLVEVRVNNEGRMLYANPTATSSPANTSGCTPPINLTTCRRAKRTYNALQVVHHENRSEDRSWLATIQLQKSFVSGYSFSVAYTKAKSEDLMSLGSSIATSNLRNTPLDGTIADRNLTVSAFDVPHKLTINGSANLPFGIQSSVIFTARAGTPYAYVYTNDANGDGNITNDLLYVPASQTDITLDANGSAAGLGTQVQQDSVWGLLDAFIEREPCVDRQRGSLMRRGSCRNPWSKFVDIRLTKVIPTLSGQSLQISADVFNFLNLLDRDWGLDRSTSFFEQTSYLTMVSSTTGSSIAYDLTNDRGVYTVPAVAPALRRVQVGASRWRIQFGGKYIF